jgi:ABC-type multidrug transport system fused ATPase/permease subunit
LALRAHLFGNSLVLILGEPTAALDVEDEQKVIEALGRLKKGRTVVMIPHRLTTLRAADKVIVVKDGVVT